MLVTATSGTGGSQAIAAAMATCIAAEQRAALLVEVGAAVQRRRPTLLATPAARECEARLGGAEGGAAARGLICHLAAGDGEEGLERAAGAAAQPSADCVVHVDPQLWLAAIEHPRIRVGTALIRAALPEDRPIAGLAVRDLRARGITVRVASRPLGWAAGRRAIAGVRPGGADEARMRRWARSLAALQGASGQVLPVVLAGCMMLLVAALAIVAIAGALTGKGRLQRAADLAALSAARSMRDDLPRVTAPPLLPNGLPNPMHMPRVVYLARARAAAVLAGRNNDADPRRLRVSFPDAWAFPPLRARVAVRGELRGRGNARLAAYAVAEAAPGLAAGIGMPTQASGGGYSGPLAYRQGEGMRPDVAAAFDRMAAAASRAGLQLVVSSGFRSDAEQAQLFAQNPDPTWVAPPGRSLHRCATELDLGPPSAYGWLAANATRFGFQQRYAWEAWHYGFSAGPAPCSRAADATGPAGEADPPGAGSMGLPSFVPARFRDPILRSAARWNVSAAMLAAQLMAESGFDPYAVSPAGAQGIAQFMPATAASYGLRDPFDPEAAIGAQAQMMSELLRRFGSVRLALAAYNAGPGAVGACGCVPGVSGDDRLRRPHPRPARRLRSTAQPAVRGATGRLSRLGGQLRLGSADGRDPNPVRLSRR